MNRAWIRRTAVLAIAGACALAASGCSSSANDAATITYDNKASNEHTTNHISTSTLLDQIDQLQSVNEFNKLLAGGTLGGGQPGVSANSQLTAAWLTQLIRQTVVNDAFSQQKLTVSAADKANALQSVQQNYTDQSNPQKPIDVFSKLPEGLRNRLVDDQAKLSAVLSSCPSGKLVSHILVSTEAEATSLYNQLKAGADFAQLAKSKSIDKASGAQGGALGCLTDGQYVKEFQTAADKLPLDVVSVPVKTQFGYHLILNRKWDQSFMQNQTIAQSVQQAAGAALNARLAAIKVHVNPRFGTWEKTESQQGATYQVTPPNAPTPNTARNQREVTTTTLGPEASAVQGG
jgi:hypothetical protein